MGFLYNQKLRDIELKVKSFRCLLIFYHDHPNLLVEDGHMLSLEPVW